MQRIPLGELVFVRDWFLVIGDCPLPARDRVGAVIEFLRGGADWQGSLASRLETRLTETNEDRDLGNFARKWVAPPLSRGLREAGLLAQDSDSAKGDRLELLLLDFETAVVGLSLADNRSPPFPQGIPPRLRLPASAPSRSALKLEEAWKVFIPEDRYLDYLGGGGGKRWIWAPLPADGPGNWYSRA